MSLPPLEELEQVVAYDPETGLFTVLKPFGDKNWVKKARDIFGRPRWAGAGELYTQVSLWGKSFYAHRIAWLLYHKRPPREGYGISHLNGNKSDNRIANLVETPIKRPGPGDLTVAPKISKMFCMVQYSMATDSGWRGSAPVKQFPRMALSKRSFRPAQLVLAVPKMGGTIYSGYGSKIALGWWG